MAPRRPQKKYVKIYISRLRTPRSSFSRETHALLAPPNGQHATGVKSLTFNLTTSALSKKKAEKFIDEDDETKR